jgi:hypothetical protein
VFFSRATDGKTVRARPSKASSTRRMEVVVPAGVTSYLTITNGAAGATRFQLQILSGKFSKKTARSRSPIVLPASATNNGGGGTVGVTPPPPADCDADGTPDSSDTDDDNDGLGDDTEANIHTDPCKKDTDGDGVADAFEYYSSLDLNGNPTYAGKRPYPNPLDAADALKDFDGDGLTQADEFAAASKFGTAITAPLTYSDGNQTSAGGGNGGVMDLNENGRISDDEKDADNDGLPNWIELAKTEPAPYAGADAPAPCAFAGNTGPHANLYTDVFTDCGAGRQPNGNTFAAIGTTATGAPAPPDYYKNDFLDADSDGDGVLDGFDDLDHDGLTNVEEIVAGGDGLFTNPVDPCDPSIEARTCPTHQSHT